MTRYLGQTGFQVDAVQRSFTDGRAASKYRQVDLLARQVTGQQNKKRVKATLVLLRPETLTAATEFMQHQMQCDKILLSVLENARQFARLELVSAPVCFGLTAQGEAQE